MANWLAVKHPQLRAGKSSFFWTTFTSIFENELLSVFMSRFSLIFFTALLLCTHLSAQGLDIFEYYQEEILSSPLQNPDNLQATRLENATLGFSLKRGKVGLPFIFNDKKDIFINVLTYKELSISSKGLDGSMEKLYSRQVQLSYLHKFNESSRLVLMGGISRSSNETSASPESQKYNGALIYNQGDVKNKTFGYGLALSYNFGEARLLPVFVYRSIGERLMINLSFPNKVAMDYQVAWKTRAGFEATVDGDQYRLLENRPHIDTAKYATANGGFYLLLGNRPGPHLKLGAGSTFYRRYQLYKDEAEVISFDLENNLFYRLSLKFGF